MGGERVCRYCGRPEFLPCMSTRDMEDRSLARDNICLSALEANGGGEIGAARIRLRLEANTTTTSEQEDGRHGA